MQLAKKSKLELQFCLGEMKASTAYSVVKSSTKTWMV